jgi:hypothetical protein
MAKKDELPPINKKTESSDDSSGKGCGLTLLYLFFGLIAAAFIVCAGNPILG